MKKIENVQFVEERALYNLTNTYLKNVVFAGLKDGESSLKHARNIKVEDCEFSLRYPMWHTKNYELLKVGLSDTARAALWYSRVGVIKDCTFKGIKALRNSDNITINNCFINSDELGWKCKNIKIYNTSINSSYIFLDSKNISLDNVEIIGKYTFQYMNNLKITNSILDTKDAFWHSKNILIKNCTLKGEYLGWYSNNLKLINCKIIGTQPLCYCKNLRLINCTMEKCDLSFEYSSVKAIINGGIESIKNPKSGIIKVDFINNVVTSDSIIKSKCKIIPKNKSHII